MKSEPGVDIAPQQAADIIGTRSPSDDRAGGRPRGCGDEVLELRQQTFRVTEEPGGVLRDHPIEPIGAGRARRSQAAEGQPER